VEPLIEAIGAETAKIMSTEELDELQELLVPAGFTILTGDEARMKAHVGPALLYQTSYSMRFEDTPDGIKRWKEEWREWWKANGKFFDNEMTRSAQPRGD
jgi:hypothetical protein